MTVPQGRGPATPVPARLLGDGVATSPHGVALRWETLYPRRQGEWTAVLSSRGEKAYGLYDPTRKALQQVAPADDLALPGLGEWLARGELVSYRVGHRAVVRTTFRGETAYAKVLPPARRRRLVTKLEAATRARSADARFPHVPVLVDDSSEGALLTASLPGQSLHQLSSGRSPLDATALDDVAQALACFHRWSASDLGIAASSGAADLEHWASVVATHFPERREAYRDALELVSAAGPVPAPSADRLVHGDLHDKNVMVSGGRVSLLDLDGIRAGDPAEDVGNLVAHFVLRALQHRRSPESGRRLAGAFAGAYRRAGGDVPTEALVAGAARSLFRLACVYRFRRRWQGLTAALLAEATEWSIQPCRIPGTASGVAAPAPRASAPRQPPPR